MVSWGLNVKFGKFFFFFFLQPRDSCSLQQEMNKKQSRVKSLNTKKNNPYIVELHQYLMILLCKRVQFHKLTPTYPKSIKV